MQEKDVTWTLAVLKSARTLEKEGFEFYTKAAGETADANGKAMFKYLAGEEVWHYDTVNDLIRGFGGHPDAIEDAQSEPSGIFGETAGGKRGRKADALDALNIGIRAEDKSIETYSKLFEATGDKNLKRAVKRLIDEERRHKAILEAEIEFVTDTGEYHDFKTITM
ncbi:MAG: ferritin family protein [Candidatus Altiarchaeota archaeon]|nr:ferritin family protein [Candidatus Altiarchaeota archaeon]